jgi:pSer/pThr/pTyr-binding forkhead associated (FHA) protein
MTITGIKKGWHRVKNLLDGRPGPDFKPLDLVSAVLHEIENKVVPRGDGRRVFPHNRIVVKLLLPPRSERADFQLALDDLESKIRKRFQEIDCDAAFPLDVRIQYLKKAPAAWAAEQIVALDLQKRSPDHPAATTAAVSLRVQVVTAAGAKRTYTFTEPRILLGRSAEISDGRGGRRRNHVALDEQNTSVSRAHARMVYDTARGGYRVLDEGSTRGTQVIRRGEVIKVPKNDPRGVLLMSGDEIQLGDVVLRVTME